MLQDIRDKSQGIVVKIIVGFIVVTFALFGVDALVTGFNTSSTVAEVDGTDITRTELLQMAEVQRRQLISVMGNQINPALLEDNLLQRRALDELIQRVVLQNNAKELNLSVSDNQVDQYILQAEQFKTDGKFDQTRYLEFIRSLGYTPRAFKQRISQDLLIQQPRSVIAGSNFVLANEVDLVSKLQNQQRSYDYIRLSLADETESTQVSDSEIESYFSEHSKDFMSPEQVKLNYVILSSVDFEDQVTVSDDELQDAYRVATATKPPEERLASHILIEPNKNRTDAQAKALAQSLKEQIDNGAKFSDLAKEYSDDLGSKKSGGNLGYVTPGSMVPEFENALFHMEVDQVSDVVKTEYGYHIIELREIVNSKVAEFSEMAAQLRKELVEKKAKQAMLSAREDIVDLAYASDSLEPLAEQYNTNVMESDWFGRQGGDELISKNSEVVSAAFSAELLEDKLNSNVIELNEEQIAVVHINEHKPETAKSLADAKDEIFSLLLNKKAIENLTVKAEKLKSNASSAGWKKVNSANRGSDEISTLAFELPHPINGKPSLSIKNLDDGDLVLLRLNKVVDGEASEDETQRGYIESYLAQSTAESLISAHQQTLQSLSEIEKK